MTIQQVIDKYQEEQGWTDATVLMLLTGYLNQQGDSDALDAYLGKIAAEENRASDDS